MWTHSIRRKASVVLPDPQWQVQNSLVIFSSLKPDRGQLMCAEQKRMISKVTHRATQLTRVSWIFRLLSAQEQLLDLLSRIKTWTLGLSLTTLVQLPNSFPVANCLACFGIAPGCEVCVCRAEAQQCRSCIGRRGRNEAWSFYLWNYSEIMYAWWNTWYLECKHCIELCFSKGK